MGKVYIACQWILFLALAAVSFRASYADAATSDKAEIQEEVKKNLPGNLTIKKTFWMDYDGNGRKEAFILTGKRPKNSEERMYDGKNTLWFGYKSGGKVHIKKIKKNIAITAHKLKLKNAAFFCAGRFVATSYPEDVYQVKGNKVSVLFSGDTIRGHGGDDFLSVHSAYDAMYDSVTHIMMGHTWKPYYFTYKNGKVQEYVASRISKEELLEKYSNAAQMLEKYKKYGSIHSILLRSNGMVHINYQKKKSKYGDVEYRYITFRASDGKLVKPDEGNGTYQEKLPVAAYKK